MFKPASITLFLVLCGCPKASSRSEDVLRPLLAAADRAWDARGTEGFGSAETALQSAYAADPDSPEVAWRVARLRVAQAHVATEPDDRISLFASARAEAWRCVVEEPRFRALQLEEGLEEALPAVPVDRELCLVWASRSWVRWMEAYGPAATALDLGALDLVLDELAKRGNHTYDERWTRALSLASRPSWAGRDLGRARDLLRGVVRADRDRLEPVFDSLHYATHGDRSDLHKQLRSGRADTPEERALQERGKKGER